MFLSTLEIVAQAVRDSFNSFEVDCYPIAKAAIEAMREPLIEALASEGVDIEMRQRIINRLK